MFSSDVTARGTICHHHISDNFTWTATGMDYPDVSLVVQVGLTPKDQYIHRIGRTARAGKGGSGVLMCAPFEERFLKKELSELPLTAVPPAYQTIDPAVTARLEATMRSASVLESADSCWAAWLGFYNSNLRKLGWNTADLVSNSRSFAASMTLDDIPELEPKTIGKMGLKVYSYRFHNSVRFV
jgi:ATP-dependent RNA helicase MSS116